MIGYQSYHILISKGIDVKKTNGSHECVILCHFYFFEISVGSQPKVCNGCHDLMQKATSIKDAAVASVKRDNYRFHFWYMNQDVTNNLSRNVDMTEKRGTFKNIHIYHHISKMSKQIIAFGNIEIETKVSSSQKSNFVRTCIYG